MKADKQCAHIVHRKGVDAMDCFKAALEYLMRAALENLGVPVKKGVFGADMKITQMNDGPVTILLEI